MFKLGPSRVGRSLGLLLGDLVSRRVERRQYRSFQEEVSLPLPETGANLAAIQVYGTGPRRRGSTMANWGSTAVYGDTITAAQVKSEARVTFIRRTYAHR